MAGTLQCDTFYNSAGTGAPAFPQNLQLGLNAFAGAFATSDSSGNVTWSGAPVANVVANDSNVVLTATSNPFQVSTPTAQRTWTMPSAVSNYYPWVVYNQATSWANTIILQTSGSNEICLVPPLGYVEIFPTSLTPTTAANWIIKNRVSQWVAYTPTATGLGTTSSSSAFAKCIGDTQFVNGSITTGTTTAALISFTLAGSSAIDHTKLSLNNSTTTGGNILGTYGQEDTVVSAEAGYVVSATSTSTTLVYFGNSYGTTKILVPQLGSILDNSLNISYSFAFSMAN